jgi:putative N6-adenine-specific DNA methylase
MEKFEYMKYHRYFAQTANSIEEMAALELSELGAEKVTVGYRGIAFEADKETLYRVLYESRLITRVIAPLINFACHSEKYLYQQVGNINWSDLFSTKQSFAINANVADSNIKNSLYAGQVMKDAIADQFRAKTGERPDYKQKEPDIRFSLHIYRNRVDIGMDVSLTSMHKRGYRVRGGAAPLQETLAAAIIRYTKWDGENPLEDPCCGTGTLIAEALMKYCRIPAGYLRRQWGLSSLPDFDVDLFNKVKDRADAEIRPLPRNLLYGSDISGMACDVTRENLSQLPGGENVKINKRDFHEHSHIINSTIVTNLPYGVRLGNLEETRLLYNDFGDFLKIKCKGSTAYVLIGDKSLAQELRLRANRTRKFKNGDIEALLLKLDLY